jgi:uncharacterized protein (DUF1800 family)
VSFASPRGLTQCMRFILQRRTRVALIGALGVAAGVLATAAPGKDEARVADRATIAHVLGRLGFGARPGDVERIEGMGITAYIDQQLHPERIDNHDVEARLAGYETLALSQHDLAEKYFAPAEQLRRQQVVKQQLAAAKTARSARQAPSAAAAPPMNGAGNADENESMMSAPPAAAPTEAPGSTRDAAAIPPEVRMARQAEAGVLQELMQAKMLRATESNRQLEEVLTDFWFNHFNVYVGKGQVRQYLTSYERDAIRPHVLGKFRDLLGAVAHSPAMLFYLDNWQSAAPGSSDMRPQLQQRLNNARPAQRQMLLQRMQQMSQQQKRPARGLNENYAREIMELHTLGVDGGYTQQDVIALARILTGWTIDRPQLGGEFVFRPQTHDQGTKTFLGVTFKADGEREGERALDMLAEHPATAHHIAYELAQRFVADEPPAGVVDRAAKSFKTT